MAKQPHVLYRNGRYYARLVVPIELQSIVGKTELREPLGADKLAARRASHAVLARLQQRLADARAELEGGVPPLARIARQAYAEELAYDDKERLAGAKLDSEYVAMVRNGYAAKLRLIETGLLSDEEAEAVIGYLAEGKDAPGIPRADLLKALAGVRLESLARAEERDRGQMTPGEPRHPLLVDKPPAPVAVQISPSASHRVLNEHSLKPLSELVGMFHVERGPHIAAKTADEHRVAVRMVEEFFGEPKPAASIKRADMLEYKRALMRTPNRYRMRFPDMTLPEAIEANEKRKEPVEPLQAATINDKWLAHIQTLMRWCVAEGILPDSPAAEIKVDTGNGFKAPTRVPFSADDLDRIFGTALFTGGSKTYGTQQWALLLALHCGSRSSSEIARVKLEDISEERGVAVIRLSEASKNRQSIRSLPIHRNLIALGFLGYVDKLRKAGQERLFPDWIEGRGDKVNRWFLRTYKKKLGIYDDRKVFHSFRHTLLTALTAAGVHRDMLELISGHADQKTSGVYIHDPNLTLLGAMEQSLNRVEFPAITRLVDASKQNF